MIERCLESQALGLKWKPTVAVSERGVTSHSPERNGQSGSRSKNERPQPLICAIGEKSRYYTEYIAITEVYKTS
jgi:hypothetical protein